MRFILMAAMAWAIGSTPLFAQSEGIQVDGKSRDFIVYAPASGLPEHPALVLALHPLGASNAIFRNMSKWDAIADREKIVVVYPQGTAPVPMGGRPLIGWDITTDADVKFLTALIDAMADRYKIDRKRVYATGFSMGGMLSYVVACRASDKVAAIGPDAGYPVGQNAANCNPSVPVPVLHVHGADDNFVTYSGAAPWVRKFAEVNKCQQTPKTTDPSPKAKKEDWTPCENGNDVIFYTIAGMGHDYATIEKFDFNATETFWAFFKAHSRSDVVAPKKK